MCEEMEILIMEKRWEEVFVHIEGCKKCKEKYLYEEPYKILRAYEEIEQEEAFWKRQRESILEAIQRERYRDYRWLRYAAFIILPVIALIIIISVNPLREKKMVPVELPKMEEELPAIMEIKNPRAHYYKIEIDNKIHLIMIVDPEIKL